MFWVEILVFVVRKTAAKCPNVPRNCLANIHLHMRVVTLHHQITVLSKC